MFHVKHSRVKTLSLSIGNSSLQREAFLATNGEPRAAQELPVAPVDKHNSAKARQKQRQTCHAGAAAQQLWRTTFLSCRTHVLSRSSLPHATLCNNPITRPSPRARHVQRHYHAHSSPHAPTKLETRVLLQILRQLFNETLLELGKRAALLRHITQTKVNVRLKRHRL